MKWWTIRQIEDRFDFREGDEVVRFAQAHGMKVRGHCLVWDHNNPDWLARGHFTPDRNCRALARAHRNGDETLCGPGFRLGCGQRGHG